MAKFFVWLWVRCTKQAKQSFVKRLIISLYLCYGYHFSRAKNRLQLFRLARVNTDLTTNFCKIFLTCIPITNNQ